MDIERFKFSLLSALTISEPMLIGLCFKQNQFASVGAFGTLGLMYYVYKSDQKVQGLKNVITFCLVTLGVCTMEVCLNSYFLAIILIAISSSFLYYWGHAWHWGPGPFFFVMITSMLAGMTNKMSFFSLVVVLIYLLIALIVSGLINRPFSYWITVGCAAVLQAYGYFQIVTRYIAYKYWWVNWCRPSCLIISFKYQ